jgi:hypothetical protein
VSEDIPICVLQNYLLPFPDDYLPPDNDEAAD